MSYDPNKEVADMIAKAEATAKAKGWSVQVALTSLLMCEVVTLRRKVEVLIEGAKLTSDTIIAHNDLILTAIAMAESELSDEVPS